MNVLKSICRQMECYSFNNPRGTDVKGGIHRVIFGRSTDTTHAHGRTVTPKRFSIPARAYGNGHPLILDKSDRKGSGGWTAIFQCAIGEDSIPSEIVFVAAGSVLDCPRDPGIIP